VESRQRSYLSGALSLGIGLLIGCAGLVWGASNAVRGAVSDDFRTLEDHLLQFETFGHETGAQALQSPAVQQLSACDGHAQRALLLLEIPLADNALRLGAVQDFDQHVRSLETRATQLLSCAPRDSLSWLLLFGLRLEHGELDERSFDLLQLSYAVSPNEAWIGVRRVAVALPVLLAAPEPVRQKILTEFQNLVRNGFLEIPALSYLKASAPVRALLQSRIENLDSARQKAFSEALVAARR
jgi:hypothetical protein